MDAAGDRRTDHDLLAAALSGDGDAFAAFYRRHARQVVAFHLSRCGSAHDAADLTAETFAAALAHLDRFDAARGEPAGWLFGIARNRLADLQRRGVVDARARRRMGIPRLALDDASLEQVAAAVSADEVRVELRAGLAALPAAQREAIGRRVLLDQDYADVAAATGVSEAVVRKRVSRGLSLLRRRLDGRDPS